MVTKEIPACLQSVFVNAEGGGGPEKPSHILPLDLTASLQLVQRSAGQPRCPAGPASLFSPGPIEIPGMAGSSVRVARAMGKEWG